MDVSFHNVEVIARPGDSVDVTVDITVKGDGSTAKNVADDLQPKFLDEGDKLIIRSEPKKGGTGSPPRQRSGDGRDAVGNEPFGRLVILGNRKSPAILETGIVFDASSGSLTVDGAMRELHSDISSGSVRAAVMRPLERFSADASSGSVRLVGGAREAKVDTSSGSINLAGLLGNAYFDASSGSITAQWNAIPADAKVRAGASSGSVSLSFPAGTVL